MRLLKWLFQPVYILLIIILVALYVNREAIFPEEVAESLEGEVLLARADALIADLSGKVSQGDTETESEFREGVTVEAAGDAPVQGDADSTEGAKNSAVQQDGVAQQFVTSPALIAIAEEKGDITSPQNTPLSQVAAAVTEYAAHAHTAPHAEPLALWREARSAVWQGDLGQAVAYYSQLIALQPENYDAHGEMGNVLLAQGSIPAAIDAYADAARLIHRSGHTRMAYRVASVVASLDEGRGRALIDEFMLQQR